MKAMIAFFTLTACHGMTAQEKATTAESTYAAEQLACVDKANTLEESKACRAEVRKKWAVGADGGAK
jgi:hypothetical protein